MDGNLKQEELDRIFSGMSNTVNSAHGFASAVCDMIDSRRNVGQQNNGTPQYQQPVQYGYGYADNSNPYGNYFNGLNQSQNNTGYPGFTNPGYGNTGMGGMY